MNTNCFGDFSDSLSKGFGENWSIEQVGTATTSSADGKVNVEVVKEGTSEFSLLEWSNKNKIAGDFSLKLKVESMKGRGLVRLFLAGDQETNIFAHIIGERDAEKSADNYYVSMEYKENGKLISSGHTKIGSFPEGFSGDLIIEKKGDVLSVQAVPVDGSPVLGGYYSQSLDVAYELKVGSLLFENVRMNVAFDNIEVACIEGSTNIVSEPIIDLDTVVTKEEIETVPFTEQTVEQQLSSFINQSTIAQYLAFGITSLGILTSILSVIGIFGVKKYLRKLRELWVVEDQG